MRRIVAVEHQPRQMFSGFYDSGAEEGSGLDLAGGEELAGGDFLAVAELRAQHLDPPALGGDLEGLFRRFNDFADLPLHGAEGADGMLARVEHLYFLPLERGPGARGGGSAPDQVIDEVDGAGPDDSSPGPSAPAL